MKELSKIIAATAEALRVPEDFASKRGTRREETAKCFVCHLIVNGYPYLASAFASQAGVACSDIVRLAEEAQAEINSSPAARWAMCDIRDALGLPNKFLRGDSALPAISDTKRLFGFDYTMEEERRMSQAMKAAAARVRALSRYGRKPSTGAQVNPSFNKL